MNNIEIAESRLKQAELELKNTIMQTGEMVKEINEKHKGLRFNNGKLRYDLVHPWAHEQMVQILTKGAQKYAERNWEKGMAWSNIISSLKRHLAAIEKGEDYDAETGELHAAHVACNAHFLTAYYKLYPEGDDRPHAYLTNKRIALDIDDVLAVWAKEWCGLHGQQEPTAWQFDRAITEKFEAMKEGKKLDEFYSNLPVLTKAEDIPFEPVLYVTARPVDTKITEAWLDKHGFPAAKVCTVGTGNSKVQCLKDEKIDIFVDDNFSNFQEINQAGICCFLFDALHNRRYNVGARRIKSLKELV